MRQDRFNIVLRSARNYFSVIIPTGNVPYNETSAYAKTDDVQWRGGERRRTMPRWLVFVTAFLAILSALSPRSFAAPALAADAITCASVEALMTVPRADLIRLSDLTEEPFADGKAVRTELVLLQEYKRITGRSYQPGDLGHIRTAQECAEKNGSVTSTSSAPAANPIDEGDDRACRSNARA